MKESGTNSSKTEVDVAIELIIAMKESADEQHDLEDRLSHIRTRDSGVPAVAYFYIRTWNIFVYNPPINF